MRTSEKILFNTIALYVKMFITIVIGLYLTRVVLENLGVEDFGIYNLIGGVIALLSFLQSALSVSSQRFLSVALGRNNFTYLKTVFMSSISIHTILSILVIIVLEIASLFLFDGFLNIPVERLYAAKAVYQIMVISTFVSIIQVPYSADITANEDLWYFAIVETLSVVFRLYIIVLFKYNTYDNLVLYSTWMLLSTVIAFVAKFLWCIIKYEEARDQRFYKYTNKNVFRKMVGFTGWNAFGTLALVGRNQGVAILINIFWGASINAVYGIANQVNGQLIHFSQIMTQSLSPQIMKSEGEGNRKRMLFLSVFASKMAFFLSAIFALPLIIEIELVLSTWLKVVPVYTELYCILILVMFLVMQLYPGLARAIQASGNIKQYQIITSIVLLLPIPFGYFMYSMDMSNSTILYLMIASQVLQMLYAITYCSKHIGLNAKSYYVFVIKSIVLFSATLGIGFYIKEFIHSYCNVLVSFISTVAIIDVMYMTLYYIVIFTKNERDVLNGLLRTILKKIL